MKTKSKFFTLFLGLSLLFAGLTGVGLTRKNAIENVKADAEPNSTYVRIYEDNPGYNNGAMNATYNITLIVYQGTAHGQPGEGIYDSAVLSKISIDGVPLTQLPGSTVIPWEGQPWLRICYPNTAVEAGSIMEVQTGLTIGDCVMNGFGLRLNENLTWDYYFGGPVNAISTGVHSNSDFNNTTWNAPYNQILVTYSGDNQLDDTVVQTKWPIKRYDAYIFIDGQPLSTLTAAYILPWGGQPWFRICYPASAVSEGSILEIRDGCKIGNVLVSKIMFRLNASSKWEKIANLIDDDELVKNNDYLLFTPTDVPSGANDSWFFYANSGQPVTEMANLNFGLQFKLNMTDEELGGYVLFKLGSSFVAEDFIQLIINFKVNTYIAKFKNVGGYTLGLTSISVTPDVDHLFEFYCLKDSDTTACFILGIDGEIIFKTLPQDISDAPECLYFGMLNSGTATVASVNSLSTTAADAIERFSNRALHMDTIPTSNVGETNACKGAKGHYAKAKEYYNKYLVKSQRVTFATDGAYANERARFIAWGAANGETLSFNGSTGALVIGSNANMLVAIVENKNNAMILIIASFVALTSIMAFLVLKKRKQN